MDQVPVSSLRKDTARILRRVKDGEALEVTEYGRPVARIVPITPDPWEQLRALGEVEPASEEGGILDDEPIPAAPSGPLLSAMLSRQRADER